MFNEKNQSLIAELETIEDACLFEGDDYVMLTNYSTLQRMNESGLVSWKGNLLISPSVNNVYNNINQSKQNFGDVDTTYINQINEVISNTSNNLEYGNFYKNWIGVN